MKNFIHMSHRKAICIRTSASVPPTKIDNFKIFICSTFNKLQNKPHLATFGFDLLKLWHFETSFPLNKIKKRSASGVPTIYHFRGQLFFLSF